jgi:hypothetical protein
MPRPAEYLTAAMLPKCYLCVYGSRPALVTLCDHDEPRSAKRLTTSSVRAPGGDALKGKNRATGSPMTVSSGHGGGYRHDVYQAVG